MLCDQAQVLPLQGILGPAGVNGLIQGQETIIYLL